ARVSAQAQLVSSVFSADSTPGCSQPAHTFPIQFPSRQEHQPDCDRDDSDDRREHHPPPARSAASHAFLYDTARAGVAPVYPNEEWVKSSSLGLIEGEGIFMRQVSCVAQHHQRTVNVARRGPSRLAQGACCFSFRAAYGGKSLYAARHFRCGATLCCYVGGRRSHVTIAANPMAIAPASRTVPIIRNVRIVTNGRRGGSLYSVVASTIQAMFAALAGDPTRRLGEGALLAAPRGLAERGLGPEPACLVAVNYVQGRTRPRRPWRSRGNVPAGTSSSAARTLPRALEARDNLCGQVGQRMRASP